MRNLKSSKNGLSLSVCFQRTRHFKNIRYKYYVTREIRAEQEGYDCLQ